MLQLLYTILGFRTDFEKLFFQNEFKALAGNKWRTIFSLLAILLLTFLALGFAIGSIDNLKSKMDNPFTNWIDIDVNREIASKSDQVQARFMNKDTASLFDLNSLVSFSRNALHFYHKDFNPFKHKKDTLQYIGWGRTIEADEALFKRILDPEKGTLIWASKNIFENEEISFSDCEIIITKSLMEDLGYENPATIGHVIINDDELVFLKVIAVVSELPGRNRFVVSPKLYNFINAEIIDTKRCRDQLLLKNEEGSNSFTFLVEKKEDVKLISYLADQFFIKERPSIEPHRSYIIGEHKYESIHLSFLPINAPSLDSIQQFVAFAKRKSTIKEHAYVDCGATICDYLNPMALHHLAFHFNRLDLIRTFKKDMSSQFGIEIDMNQVEAKENFALVSRLTLAISFILLIFGILSIVLFVNNLLKTHLHKIRSNLGTFQAFGLSNKFLVLSYLKIIFSFLFISILIAFFLAVIADRIEYSYFLDESRFNIFDYWILLAVLALIAVSLALSTLTIKKILGDTPGNLIYER